MRKLVFGVTDQVRHKPVCTATEDGKRLDISDVEGLYYPYRVNKGAVTAKLICVFVFPYGKAGFLMTRLILQLYPKVLCYAFIVVKPLFNKM